MTSLLSYQPRNLVPGQYQIGNKIMGRGTTVPMETFDVKPYDVNSQDHQITRTDKKNFGWDQLSPTTIEMTFHILFSRMLPGYEDLIPNFWAEMPTRADFQEIWKFDEGRYIWGSMMPLYVCARDGITKTVFGRPGQFTYGASTLYSESEQCLGEFRCADANYYGIYDRISQLITQANPTRIITAPDSDAPPWIKLLLRGPIVDPKFTLDGLFNQPNPIEFQLDRNVANNEIIEINGEFWNQRAVSSTGENLGNSLTNYLDKLRFYCKDEVEITLSGTGMSGATQAYASFRDAYQVIS